VREPVYAQADLVVECADGPHGAMVDRITAELLARRICDES